MAWEEVEPPTSKAWGKQTLEEVQGFLDSELSSVRLVPDGHARSFRTRAERYRRCIDYHSLPVNVLERKDKDEPLEGGYVYLIRSVDNG
jgi:hypothetical protein